MGAGAEFVRLLPGGQPLLVFRTDEILERPLAEEDPQGRLREIEKATDGRPRRPRSVPRDQDLSRDSGSSLTRPST